MTRNRDDGADAPEDLVLKFFGEDDAVANLGCEFVIEHFPQLAARGLNPVALQTGFMAGAAQLLIAELGPAGAAGILQAFVDRLLAAAGIADVSPTRTVN